MPFRKLIVLLEVAALLGAIGCSMQETAKPASLHTYLVKGRVCGMGGQVDVLTNTDQQKGYMVTYQETRESEGRTTSVQHAVPVEAGGRTNIGCSHGSEMPAILWKRQVIGETPVQ